MKIKLIFFLLPLMFGCHNDKQASKYPANIGDIAYDPSIDNPNFSLCDDKHIHQYFYDSNGLQYEGEKEALDSAIFEGYKNLNLVGESGLIRIRFIVNCKGETDRFRLLAMDNDYKQSTIDSRITTQLMEITKGLKGWLPKAINNKQIDYYQYLLFKIENGHLMEIMP